MSSRTLNLFFSFLFLVAVSGCALAPLSTPKTGRSLGKKNWSIDGSVYPAMSVMLGYGASETLDVGALMEFQFGSVLSVWAKKSLLNNSEGMAFSIYGGLYQSSGLGESEGYYLGQVVSYRTDKIEFYLSAKYNYVDWTVAGVTQEDVEDSLFFIENFSADFDFAYIQSDIGFNYWMMEKMGFNLHAKHFLSLDKSSVDFSNDLLLSCAVVLLL